PVALSGLELGLDDESFKAIDEQLDFGKEMVDFTLEGGEQVGDWLDGDRFDLSEHKQAHRAEGAVLREFHHILKSIDPTLSNIGLERVMDKQGRFVWVHPKYMEEYD
ncbi:MAG: hypothetical protein AAGH79_17900, partial [Bacteroidota bacterium]